jgi:phage gpG-like protein
MELATRSRRTREPVAKAVDIGIASIQKNFDVGGRPKWRGLAKSTLRTKRGGSILVGPKARLRNSFRPKATNSGGEAFSNVIYGPRQNFGYPGGPGRGHSFTPARTFVMWQDEDIRDVGEVFARHLWS